MIPWKMMFRVFAEKYGWCKAQILPMTLYEIRMYLTPDENVQNQRKFTLRKLAEAHQRKVKAERDALAKRIVEGVTGGR